MPTKQKPAFEEITLACLPFRHYDCGLCGRAHVDSGEDFTFHLMFAVGKVQKWEMYEVEFTTTDTGRDQDHP